MRTLASKVAAVLMDLRSFSPSNQGCLFELEQLLNEVPLERIVFLIDATTDRAFLERAMQDAWRRVHADSPNRRMESPAVALVHARARKAIDIHGLLKLLLTAPDVAVARTAGA